MDAGLPCLALLCPLRGPSAGDANFEDPENAQAIVVPGWEISADMEQDKWDAILEHPQIVFARTSPQQKLVIVENNQVCALLVLRYYM